MNIDTLVVGAFEVNCFIIHGMGNRVIVIDPGDDAAQIAGFIGSRNLIVSAYLLTHGHADHVSALTTLIKRYPAPAYIHPADGTWAFSRRNQIPPYYSAPEAPPEAMRDLREGMAWSEAGLEITVLETPGHTPGCVCFYFSACKALITGDTLFSGSAGRTDLPGGDEAIQSISLQRLKTFDDDVCIYPGHGPCSTIGREKRVNLFMQ